MIRFEKVSKKFSSFMALKGISFHVKKGETLVLLGKSGCGKTTAMKMINRLIEPSQGKIYLNGKVSSAYDPILLRRMIGYAIQSVGLFDHMSVFENIALVPKMLKWEEKRIKKRVFSLLEMLGFDPKKMAYRFPKELSGGERQRIGVACALAADPPIILMDEPFAALDPITREQLQNEFLELESDIQKTVVFVTHDIFEAVKMADRIALLHEGKIIQIATPTELIQNPKNSIVKKFLGPHKLQLTLMTESIEKFPLIEKEKQDIEKEKLSFHLHSKNSIIEALDIFKEANQKKLPLFKGKQFLGFLEKKNLLEKIYLLLQEQNDEKCMNPY